MPLSSSVGRRLNSRPKPRRGNASSTCSSHSMAFCASTAVSFFSGAAMPKRASVGMTSTRHSVNASAMLSSREPGMVSQISGLATASVVGDIRWGRRHCAQRPADAPLDKGPGPVARGTAAPRIDAIDGLDANWPLWDLARRSYAAPGRHATRALRSAGPNRRQDMVEQLMAAAARRSARLLLLLAWAFAAAPAFAHGGDSRHDRDDDCPTAARSRW